MSSSYVPIHQLTPALGKVEYKSPSVATFGKENNGRSTENFYYGYGKRTELEVGILGSASDSLLHCSDAW